MPLLGRLGLAFRVTQFATMPDRAAAAAYLARHPELAGSDARAHVAAAVGAATRQGNLPLLHQLYERAEMLERARIAEQPPLAPLDAEEILRRFQAVMEPVASGSPAELEAALEAVDALVGEPGFATADARARLPVLADAGALWMEHYLTSRSASDLAHARSHLTRAAALVGDDQAAEAAVLGSLALLYRNESELTSDPAYLRLAVETLRRCLSLRALDETAQALETLKLAAVLMELFIYDNEARYVDEAAVLFRSLEMAPLPGQARLAVLCGLGGALVNRHRVNGHATDLDDGVRAFEAALRVPGLEPDDRRAVLAGLGSALVIRGTLHENDAERLHGARLLGELVGTPVHPADHPSTMALQAALARMTGTETPTPSVEQLREAVAALGPGGGVWKAQILSDLGEAIVARWRTTGEGALDDLNEAVTALREAGRLRDSPQITARLALALAARSDATGSPWDRGRARRQFRAACHSGLPEAVLVGGWAWGDWALESGDWSEAWKAYGYALDVSDRLFTIQAARAHKEIALRNTREFASSAAYAAMRAGHAKRAVEVLEHGRARLVADALSLRDPELVRLEHEHPVAAARFRQSAEALDAMRASERTSTASPERKPVSYGSRSDLLDTLRTELDRALAEVRNLPGYANFQTALSASAIATAARAAPIVYISVTGAGGLALLVEPAGEPIPVWLDALSKAAVREQLERGYVQAYRLWLAALKDGKNHPGSVDPAHQAWRKALDDALRWAWDAIMAPILEALHERSLKRAVLVPQGLLQLLPLNAAWTDDPGSPNGRSYAGDQVRLTVAPGARLLLGLPAPPAAHNPGTLLLIDNPDRTLHNTDGPAVRRRGEGVGWKVETLAGSDATLERVLSLAPGADVLHFSTHGRAVVDQPPHLRPCAGQPQSAPAPAHPRASAAPAPAGVPVRLRDHDSGHGTPG